VGYKHSPSNCSVPSTHRRCSKEAGLAVLNSAYAVREIMDEPFDAGSADAYLKAFAIRRSGYAKAFA
jgi:hypothetical protein